MRKLQKMKVKMSTQKIKFEGIQLNVNYHGEPEYSGDKLICDELIIDSIAVIDSVIDIKELISDEKNEDIYKYLTEYFAEEKAGI
jgi:hypothetical protein